MEFEANNTNPAFVIAHDLPSLVPLDPHNANENGPHSTVNSTARLYLNNNLTYSQGPDEQPPTHSLELPNYASPSLGSKQLVTQASAGLGSIPPPASFQMEVEQQHQLKTSEYHITCPNDQTVKYNDENVMDMIRTPRPTSDSTQRRGECRDYHSKSKCRMSLLTVLLFQCLFVAAVFIVLIVMMSVVVDSETKKLVKLGVSYELDYARARILAPIMMYEKTLLGMRQSYLAQREIMGGAEPCSESTDIQDSAAFFADGMAVIDNNPFLSFVYHLRRSKTRFRGAVGEVVECDATPEYVMIVGNESKSTDSRITIKDYRNLSALPTEADDTDYFYEEYVSQAFAVPPSLTWIAYTYYDVIDETTDLLISAHAPMAVLQTYSNGSTSERIPTLTVPAVHEGFVTDDIPIAEEVVSTLVLEASMTAFAALMKAITPDVSGAHTTLYDIGHGTLLTTSFNMPIFNHADSKMWVVGQTPSPAVNAAFHVAQSTSSTKLFTNETYVTLTDDFESEEVEVFFDKDRIVSSVPVTTTSGISFLIVQSTPSDFYLKTTIETRNVMIIVGVVAACMVLVLCISVSVLIRIPLRSVEANMQLASAFKNEKVTEVGSSIAEVAALCAAFERMNHQLLEARPFLPQAMLTNQDTTDGGADEEEGDGEDEDGNTIRLANLKCHSDDDIVQEKHEEAAIKAVAAVEGNRAPPPGIGITSPSSSTIASQSTWYQHSNAPSRHTHQNKLGVGDTGTQSSFHSAGGRLAPLSAFTVASTLSYKRVTILAINVRGFHSMISNLTTATISSLSAELTKNVYDVCSSHRGVVDSFHGDHFILSFNAAKYNAQGAQRAVKAAMELAEMKNQLKNTFDGSNIHVLFSMGASTGKACVGQLGSDGMKRLSIIGKVYSRALALESLCKRTNTFEIIKDELIGSQHVPIQLTVGSQLASEVSHLYLVQLLGGLRSPPFGSNNNNNIALPHKSYKNTMELLPHTNKKEETGEESNIVDSFQKMRPEMINGDRIDHIYAVRQAIGLQNKGLNFQLQGITRRDLPVSGCKRSSQKEIETEWMYHSNKAAEEDPMLSEVNAAVLAFLNGLVQGESSALTPSATTLPLHSSTAEGFDLQANERISAGHHLYVFKATLSSIEERYASTPFPHQKQVVESCSQLSWGHIALSHARQLGEPRPQSIVAAACVDSYY